MRIDYRRTAPEGLKPLLAMEKYLNESGLEPSLMQLVKMRASMINGCAYCIDMHSKDARAEGETEQRLYALSAWHESPFYTDRERAALEWTDALTLVSVDHVPDAVYERVKTQFNEKELTDLTYAVMAINSWNRLAIALRPEVGRYHPAVKAAKQS